MSLERFCFSLSLHPETLQGVHAITLSRSAWWKDDPAFKGRLNGSIVNGRYVCA